MNATDAVNINMWCHMCTTTTQAALNNESCEYECTICQSDCVEKLDQGIEEFNASNLMNSPPLDSNETNELVQTVMNRILGVGNAGSGGIINQHNVSSAPIGFILRQPAGNGTYTSQPIAFNGGDLSSLSGLLSMADANIISPTASALQNRNIFGILSSLNSIRDTNIYAASDESGEEFGASQFEELLHHILMNESSHAGAPPAPKQLLESLIRETITAETDVSKLGECCITQDPFEVGDVMIPLPCGHNYKQEPIVHWLEMHNTCPVCRVEIKGSM